MNKFHAKGGPCISSSACPDTIRGGYIVLYVVTLPPVLKYSVMRKRTLCEPPESFLFQCWCWSYRDVHCNRRDAAEDSKLRDTEHHGVCLSNEGTEKQYGPD